MTTVTLGLYNTPQSAHPPPQSPPGRETARTSPCLHPPLLLVVLESVFTGGGEITDLVAMVQTKGIVGFNTKEVSHFLNIVNLRNIYIPGSNPTHFAGRCSELAHPAAETE